MKDHEYYEFLISRNKDNDLDNNEKIELKRHLDSCDRCRGFNAKINKLSSFINLEERPVIVAREVNAHKFNFNKNYIFSMAAALVVFVGAVVFLSNNYNRKALEDKNAIAKVDISTNENIPIDNYDANNRYDTSAPLAIFFAEYDEQEEDNYNSKPMETYFVYSMSEQR